ncbi:hypothetical protein, partial [Nocardioides sp. R-C-SC26]|uniref:hypothetical protein n=1 Tax=Nocardioides sp. R-C-SC26 TaxID=2870414 RepID=UPI001E62E581
MLVRASAVVSVLLAGLALMGAGPGAVAQAEPSARARAAAPDYSLVTLRQLQTYGAAVYGANNWASPDAVELFTDAEGRVGVATVDNGALVVDRYDAETWTKVGSRTQIAFGDWNLYGGFLAADGGTFYLLLGRSNRQENDARGASVVPP